MVEVFCVLIEVVVVVKLLVCQNSVNSSLKGMDEFCCT